MQQHMIRVILDHDEATPLPAQLQQKMINRLHSIILNDEYLRPILREHDITIELTPSTRNPLRKNTTHA